MNPELVGVKFSKIILIDIYHCAQHYSFSIKLLEIALSGYNPSWIP